MDYGYAGLVLLGFVAIGGLAQWGAGKLDESGHWVARIVWGVLIVLAFIVLNLVVPGGKEEVDRQIQCEYDPQPGCPGYRGY
jgi:hypothetical protein